MNPANVNASGVQDVAAQARGCSAAAAFFAARAAVFMLAAPVLLLLVQGLEWLPAALSQASPDSPPTPCPAAAQHLDRLSFLQHLEAAPPVTQDKKEKPVYYRIANHYK